MRASEPSPSYALIETATRIEGRSATQTVILKKIYLPMQCFSSDWCNGTWSPWLEVGRATSTGRTPTTVPDAPGVYRIRAAGLRRMVYIGECSSLSNRLLGTWTRLNGHSASEFSSDEPVARRLAHLREAHKLEYQISFYAAHHEGRRDLRLGNEQWRKGLEARLMWEYRLEMRVSSVANHRRSTRREGDQLAARESKVGFPHRVRPSSRPLPRPDREPHSELWMGRRWTLPAHYKEMKREKSWKATGKELRESGGGIPILYKLLDPATHEMVKVGYSKRGSAGACVAALRLPEETMVAWTPLARGAARQEYVLQELKDDLIGGYFYQTGSPPARQFSGDQPSGE